MRKLLLSTALVLPMATGAAFSQEAQEGETVIIESETVTESDFEAAGEEAGQALGEAAEATGDAIEQGAEATGAAIEGAVEGAQDEMQEVEVETVPAEEAETQEVQVETVPADAAEMEPAEGEAVATSEAIMREQAPNELRVDWITGTTVRSPDGESVGEINDLILDHETGQMTAAIIGVGGFLGIGEKQIAVDWNELRIDYDANEITASITRAEADAAAEYVFREQEPPPAPEPAVDAGGVPPEGGLAPVGDVAPEGEPPATGN